MNIIDVSDTLPWNTNGQRWKKRQVSQIKNIVIHQSLGTKTVADTNKFCITNSPNITLGRGMPRIAYTFFIEPDGKIYQCNKLEDITSHVKNKNTISIAICLGGYYNYIEDGKLVKCRDGESPKAQIDALAWTVAYLRKLLYLTNKDVYTHDELQGKPSCPGNTGAAFVKKLRKNK